MIKIKTPAVVLINPKYAHNVGVAVRAASCFGIPHVYWTGSRINLEDDERLPREERMRGIYKVTFEHLDDPRMLSRGGTPVAVEFDPAYPTLFDFDHPDDAIYVFGPEDGGLQRGTTTACHRFVRIQSDHCLNLASAVSVVLHDRRGKE